MKTRLVTDVSDLRKLYAYIQSHPDEPVGFDTEASGPLTLWKKKNQRIVDDITAEIAGFSVAVKSTAVYVPINHKGVNIEKEVAIKFLNSLFSLPNVFWAHNWVYDLGVLENFLGHPMPVGTKLGDSMVLTWLTANGILKFRGGKPFYKHGLKDLVLHHFNHQMTSYEDTVGIHKKLIDGPTNQDIEECVLRWTQEEMQSKRGLTKAALKRVSKREKELRAEQVWEEATMADLTGEEVLSYGCDDAFWCLQLAKRFSPKLQEMEYYTTFIEVEGNILKVLRHMRKHGVYVDRDKIASIKETLQPHVDALAKQWKELVGCDITSSTQCERALYHQQLLWPKEGAPLTKSGKYSVAKDAIDFVETVCPKDSLGYKLAIIKKEHSKLSKIVTTYTDSLTNQLPFRPDGRVRCQFSQIGTETGRFNCTDPNMQNWPRPVKDLPDIRSALVATPGHKIVSVDYSQIEIVIMAHYSKDANLTAVVLEGKSMHDITAEALGISRNDSKKINFTKAYGGGAKKLAIALKRQLVKIWSKKQERMIDIAPDDVQEYDKKWDEVYSGVLDFRASQAAFCRQTGYITTILGRRRYIGEINHPDVIKRWHAERLAANCFDLNTEVLSRTGWKRLGEISIGDDILAKDPNTNELIFKPIEYITYYPEHSSDCFEFSHRDFSAVTTGEHRWLVSDREGNNLIRTTNTIDKNGDHKIHRSGRWLTPTAYSDDFVRLVGWFLTDGSLRLGKYTVTCIICQSHVANPRKCQIIELLLNRMGIPFHKYTKGRMSYWSFRNAYANDLGTLFPTRELTFDFIYRLSANQCNLLFKTMSLGDGHRERYNKNWAVRRRVGTSSTQTAEALQVCCMLAGYGSSIATRDFRQYNAYNSITEKFVRATKLYYVVSRLQRNVTQVLRAHTKKINPVPVWCPTVSTGFIVVRRNGHVYVTGQTPIQGSAADLIKKAMVDIYRNWTERNYPGKMLLQVHDELVFELPEKNLDEEVTTIVRLMENAIKFSLPVKAEAKIGDSWEK